ncbi:AAA family ATPase [Archangium violaceum]|uniref:AAA domain-containing protein n=1 Tax=Archangium violaceum TaxID=83451 RepID=UPI00193AE7B9|nr:AAA domain-containing protein [Archangium violaceum]QRK05241.1 AAA family ATPase [Archangium violaceum]
MRLFEQLYALHGRLEREGERLELVLGDGILSWRRPDGGVFHPILLQRVQLEFNPSIPEFTVTDSGREVDLYSELFRTMEEMVGKMLARCRTELAEGGYGPLGGADTSGFLRRLVVQLSAQAQFREDGPPKPDADPPEVGRDPVLFLRTRSLGFARILEGILEDTSTREDVPVALLRIVGSEVGSVSAGPDEQHTEAHGEPLDVLLSKPANPEQVQIAQRLERHGCVLVQGPPGTGKTHTIANLVGHLLAQGKSVLVTSHTTKALKVLRDKVVPELRPLCVSVLESDLESRKQLEGAVAGIAERLSSSDVARLDAEAALLARRRQQLLEELRCARADLLDAQADEYRDVVVAGKAWPPSQAARHVAAEEDAHCWLPGPVKLGAALPLLDGEVRELYLTNTAVSAEHEGELACSLPEPGDLLAPQEFEALLQRRRVLGAKELGFRAELWATRPHADDPVDLDALADRCRRAMAPLADAEAWKLAVISAGVAGETEAAPWHSLVALVERVRTEAVNARELLLDHAPNVVGDLSLEEQLRVVGEIQHHLESGGTLSAFSLLTRGAWKRFIRGSRVATGVPRQLEHFRALGSLLRVKELRQALAGRWDRQMGVLGAPASAQLGEAPEDSAMQYCGEIRRGLAWASSVWGPLEMELEQRGLRWRVLLDEAQVNLGPHGSLLRLRDTVVGVVTRVVQSRAWAVEQTRINTRLDAAARKVATWGGAAAPSTLVRALHRALEAGDAQGYAETYARFVDVHGRRRTLERRRELLGRLEAVAPGWAAAVRERRGINGNDAPPSSPVDAWCWRQLHDELERRGRVQLPTLQEQIESKSNELRRTTAELIERRAWAAQVRRTTVRQQQALVGWLDLVRRIGKGTGKRAPLLKAEAARQMNKCREAVPVWVMPLTQVVENFDASTRFDVVIIDEASQSDVMALVALYMADYAVVVGDHEQVSPSAVGQNLDVVQHLIDEHLAGIPNAMLYDGRMSVYDLARQSFGGMVCLTEHFRCVPDIIEFSNQLSYEGRIKPLREAADATLKPALLTHRVSGRAEAKVNRQEALAVASLIVAAVERSEYSGRTFGVISLVGEEQALEVEQLLREHLHPTEYERRRILCGNAAQFQGDERDVMFLSMVDSPQGGPLTLRATQDFKQRFNVAVSRARDQLWVVYSLNAGVDLKPDDLRRRLLDHCANPWGLGQAIQRAEAKTESPFEQEVLARLVRAGYRVTPQWAVGHYRIDLVVEGGGRRLAVECDGDRYHPLEKLPEDMARQAILERLGWRFVRLRGSSFFRNPEAAMQPVFARLRELGISPEGGERNASEEPASMALHASLVQRAEALQREWEQEASLRSAEQRKSDDESALPRVGRSPAGSGGPGASARAARGAAGRVVGQKATSPADAPAATVAEGFKPALSVHAAPVAETDSRPMTSPVLAVPRPAPAEQVKHPVRARSPKDPLPDTVAALLSENSFTCPACGGGRRLWVGDKGPFLKCNVRSCLKSEGVSVEILTEALKQLAAKCSCLAPMKVERGPTGLPVLGCSEASTCRKSFPWKEFRDRLRGRLL